MGKFDSNKGRSASRGDKKPARGAADKDSKGDGYKAKRSFTKNKSFRDGKETGGEKPARNFETRGDKTFERPFKRSYGPADEKPKRSFGGDGERKPYKKDDAAFGDKPRRSFGADSDRKPFKKDFGGEKDSRYGDKPRRSSAGSDDRKPFKRDSAESERPRRSSSASDDRKPFKRDGDAERPRRSSSASDDRKPFKKDGDSERPRRSSAGSDDRKPFKRGADDAEKPRRSFAGSEERKPYKKSFDDGPKRDADEKPKRRSKRDDDDSEGPKRVKFDDFEDGKAFSNTRKKEDYNFKPKPKPAAKPKVAADGMIRLNKYLSNAGVASRRDADNLILSGTVKVNGVVVDQLGSKINPGDKVTYGDAAVRSERKVYLLLNKPKDYITTVDDPQERKTVMELIKGACRERIYPVGRLDRNTTGLLLFTNDGELTTKLTHPKFNIKKVYHVSINKGLKPDDFAAISEGIELEDGFVKADDVAFVGEGKKEIGIEIHSGRNRIVRRIFEHLGYDVLKLDRVVFAGLTKKDLPRGKHRFLTAKEIGFLQMIG